VSQNYDDFADIVTTNKGVFGDSEAALDPGLKAHDGVEIGILPEGAAFEFRCTGCGKMRRLIIEYAELIALKYFISPHEAFRGPAAGWCQAPTTWRFLPGENHHGLVLRCSMCPYHYPLRLRVNEPEQFLAAARRQNLIDPRTEQAIATHCNAVSQQRRAQR